MLGQDKLENIASGLDGLLRFKKTEVRDVLLSLPHKTIVMFCGNQGGKCLTEKTLIDTTDGSIEIGELYRRGLPFSVMAWDGEKPVLARANPPIKKQGIHKCYRINFSDGRWVEAADHHRILTEDHGYLSTQDVLCTYLKNLELTNSESCRSAHVLDASHLCGKRQGSQVSCSSGSRQYGGQLHSDRDTGQACSPLQADAQGRNSLSSYGGGLGNRYTYNPLKFLRLHANLDGALRFLARFFGALHRKAYNTFGQFLLQFQAFLPQFATEVVGLRQDTSGLRGLSQSISAQKPPTVKVINGNQIVSWNPVPRQEVYDFEVPIYHNYITAGLVHHNTATSAYQYAMRTFGLHPIEEKNRLAKKVRCMSSSLPESSSPEEQDNTQYLELKKFIPYEQIEKDITARSQNLVVRRPPGLSSRTTVFEFRSSKQEMQDLGKIQLSSAWHDEETPKNIREECKYRLLAENGDEVFTVTLTNPLSYVYDELWQRASVVYRTKSIREKFGQPEIERRKTGNPQIAAIQMATDDNPTLTRDAIERLFEEDDEATQLLRRYGVPAHVTGRVHKTYNPSVGYIDYDSTFPEGIPYQWVHTRGIDYHESRTPWSVGWLSASPEDEWFLWNEFHPAIDGANAYNTYEICKTILRRSGDYIYNLNIIDPLANKKQPNTGFTVVQDMNRYFQEIRRNEGIGTDAYWKPWDTKGTGGRSEISKRFKNAARCGKPFNNLIKENGKFRRLPTLWITNRCPNFHKSIMNWRYGEYSATNVKMVNDPKNQPQQKYSHDNMVLECLAKEKSLLMSSFLMSHPPSQMRRGNMSVTGR